jgi:hypothetical protein
VATLAAVVFMMQLVLQLLFGMGLWMEYYQGTTRRILEVLGFYKIEGGLQLILVRRTPDMRAAWADMRAAWADMRAAWADMRAACAPPGWHVFALGDVHAA